LDNLNDSENVNRAWESIRTSGTDSLGVYELKQHKLWFNEEYLDFLDHRKQATMHCLQDPSSNNVDNLNIVRREASRHCRNIKKEDMKVKIEELETNSKIKKHHRLV
jgi:hypothetical protein